MLKLAAIDIGSNAVRLQVTRVTEYEGQTTFKKLEYVRFPMRLGHDVFKLGRIGEESKDKFFKLMQAFKILIDLYEVDDYMACATSAMRESENGRSIVTNVAQEHGIQIDIIDGTEEAELINKAIFRHMDDHTHLHIDVGGGSTELNLYVKNEKVATQSFQVGSVRRLEHLDTPEVWENMQKWVETHVKKEYGRVKAIGTGGNINKILDLSGKKAGKSISLNKIKQIQEYVAGFTLEERINKLQLNPDRADVIIPATDIYTSVMKWAKASSIIVPDSGLKDGIMQTLFERNLEKMQEKRSYYN